ncbi:uncharacterized protein CLUP02_00899 [Colletotrichum lupini]|uniref:Uncharacterized protein n=1 Tax=Colletotrichum lupini TaxID=145971 RepID=A0A9Q8SBB0_9PEZI|nr:uncharacterized protein CLUP02_00899 [Colletotrichum lupini]UQC74251.1 hypothetical protein CLUP02_00899 [Colletotrichum lupini]
MEPYMVVRFRVLPSRVWASEIEGHSYTELFTWTSKTGWFWKEEEGGKLRSLMSARYPTAEWDGERDHSRERAEQLKESLYGYLPLTDPDDFYPLPSLYPWQCSLVDELHEGNRVYAFTRLSLSAHNSHRRSSPGPISSYLHGHTASKLDNQIWGKTCRPTERLAIVLFFFFFAGMFGMPTFGDLSSTNQTKYPEAGISVPATRDFQDQPHFDFLPA